jgi:hypothetical protein
VSARTVLLLHSSAGAYGADRQLLLIAAGLDSSRYRPVVVLACDGPLRTALADAGVETHIGPLAVLRRGELSARGLAGLAGRVGRSAVAVARLARRHQAALIHSNTSVTLSGAAAARLCAVPHVWHVREIYADFARLWPLHRRLLLSAQALPCVSKAVEAQFAGASQTRVLHDGLAISDDPPPPPSLELPPSRLVCAVLGRISSWKGQDILLRAVARLDGVTVIVAGDAWSGQEERELELRRLAEHLGIAERVRFTGFVEDPRSVYGACDVVVVPSTNPDPLPNSALEGAAAGRCIVASAHGGLLEIVRDGQTGMLVAPGDVGALAAALGRLAAEPELAKRLGAAAATDVRARFSARAALEGVQALYDELQGDA